MALGGRPRPDGPRGAPRSQSPPAAGSRALSARRAGRGGKGRRGGAGGTRRVVPKIPEKPLSAAGPGLPPGPNRGCGAPGLTPAPRAGPACPGSGRQSRGGGPSPRRGCLRKRQKPAGVVLLAGDRRALCASGLGSPKGCDASGSVGGERAAPGGGEPAQRAPSPPLAAACSLAAFPRDPGGAGLVLSPLSALGIGGRWMR